MSSKLPATPAPLALPAGPEELAPVSDVTLTLVAELDHTELSFLDVARWVPGSLIRLPNSAGETIAVRIGDVPLLTGEVLVVDGVLAVRVSDIAGAPSASASQAN